MTEPQRPKRGQPRLIILFYLLHHCQSFLLTQTTLNLRHKGHLISTTGSCTSLSEKQEDSGNGNDTFGERRIRNLQQVFDTDVMPRREGGAHHTSFDSTNYALQDWGIERHENPSPQFPNSFDAVAEEAFRAIVGTWEGKAAIDPSHASNAMAKNTVFDYRPVKQESDRGRIGIEISGARLLYRNDLSNYGDSNGNALRRIILVLASKIAKYTSEQAKSEPTKSDRTFPPVAIYFNTMKQTLAATTQLQILQHQSKTFSNNITIHCLGQDDDLPSSLKAHSSPRKTKTGRARKKQKSTGLDPTRGVVIVVQPTDFNDEYRPPGPAVGVLPSFQKLVARASALDAPVIMVSPRFLVDATFGFGWAQTNGGQQAATYGGLEPPRGPVPWILRDFSPPVYCWIGNAVPLKRHRQDGEHYREQHYSFISLSQSVMEEGHPWHVFAAHRPDPENQLGMPLPFVYEYLASTKSSQGRPTRDITRRILGEFGSA